MTKAKIQLILSQPFFATLLMAQKVVEDSSVNTAAIDGENIKYNPEAIDKMDIEQVKGLLCSAVLKIANLHHLRREGRDADTWSKASEYAVNPLVKSAGMKLPQQSLISDKYNNLAAEQIFKLLPGEKPKEDPNGNGQGQGQGNNNPGQGQGNDSKPGAVQVQDSPLKTQAERQEQESKIKQRVSQAAAIAKRAGKLPGELAELVKEILEPSVNWREVVARFVYEIAKNDYSFSKPNPRYISSGFYLPSLQNLEPGTIIFIVDTSGSMDSEIFKQIAGDVQEVSQEIGARLIVIYADTKVQGEPIEIEPGETPILEPKGRGGTDFAPAFNYLTEHNIQGKAIIYLTDGECHSFPDTEPDAPTLWVKYGNYKRFAPPFGEIIQVN